MSGLYVASSEPQIQERVMQSGDDPVDAYPEQGEQQDFCPQGVPEPLPDRIRQGAGHCQRRQEEAQVVFPVDDPVPRVHRDAAAPEGKQPRKISPQAPQIRDGEHHPGQRNQEPYIQMPHHRVAIQELPQPELFHDDEEPQRQPPDKEIQCHAMPDARGQPYDQQIAHRPRRASPASPQGDVQVVPKPPPQRHMPSAVILADAQRAVGMVEVPGEPEAQHAAQSHGHQAVPLEVEQELHRVCRCAHPGQGRGDALEAHGPDVVPEDAHSVRDDDFEGQAYDH